MTNADTARQPIAVARGTAVSVRELTKTFGSGPGRVVAVDDVSMRIAGGGALALTGASGSGKSTLLHLLGAIERPDGGRIDVGEAEITALGRRQLADYRRSIGFVFQRYHRFPRSPPPTM